MKQVNIKKLLILNLPYLLIGLYASKLGQAYRLAAGADLSAKLLHIGEGFAAAFASPFPSFHPQDLLVGLLCGAALRLAVYIRGKNAKKYRKDVEYGSARWGTAEDIKPFVDPVFENNIILTQTESLMMSNRPPDPKNARNKNVLVVGGSGSGKTRFWLKPNLLQCHSSYVVTDPKGSIVIECGKLLQRNGYRIKILNTINFKKSLHYNPFAYIHSEKDILKLVTTLIANTKGEGKGGDDFWLKAETLLYCALIGYIHYEAPVEEQNFSTLIEFINAMEVREDDEEFKNPVDLMFEELAQREPDPGGHSAGQSTMQALLRKAMGGGEEMKLLLKILAAPVIVVLTVFVWVCVLILHISALILGLAGTVVALLGLAVLITYSVKNGIILLVIAFLLSPFGLPMLAVLVLGLLQDVNYALRDFIRCR